MNQFMDKDSETLHKLIAEKFKQLGETKSIFDIVHFDFDETADLAEALGYRWLDNADKIRRGEIDKL